MVIRLKVRPLLVVVESLLRCYCLLLECMAIVWAIDKFSCYLYGRSFTLQSDHHPLTYLNSSKLTNPRLMCLAL